MSISKKENIKKYSMILVCLITAGCFFSGAEKKMCVPRDVCEMNESIRLKVIVSKYQTEAVHDDFLDGTSRSFDLTVLQILEPNDRMGQILNILHHEKPMPNSNWTATGQKFTVDIKKIYLNSSIDLRPDFVIFVK